MEPTGVDSYLTQDTPMKAPCGFLYAKDNAVCPCMRKGINPPFQTTEKWEKDLQRYLWSCVSGWK